MSKKVLAALFGAWVQQVSAAQRVGWQDAVIGAGLAALWLLQKSELQQRQK